MTSTLALHFPTPAPNSSPPGGGERRRGACPGLSMPMSTGDGLLVRLLPVGTIPLDAFVSLCAAAREHGNGIVEITARGSIQIRGLSAASAPRFADSIAALNIAADDGIPVHSTALAGLDPDAILDASRLAAALRQALSKTSLAARLAPKVSVAIDGGGTLRLDGLAADVRLSAAPVRDGAVLRVGVGGDDTSATKLGAVAPQGAIDAAVRLLEVIARGGRSARARDMIAANGIAAFHAAVADLLISDSSPGNSSNAGEPIGTHRLSDGILALGIGLAFGHAGAVALERLSEAAHLLGATGLRAAPGRALIIIGLADEGAPRLAATAERLGFMVRADDPRRHVIACAGAPICRSAHIAARAIAPQIAAIAAPHLGPKFDIHISGCAKGCAHAKAAALTVVGTPQGCALIANGSVRESPFATVVTDQLPAAIEQYLRARQREDRQKDHHV
jgi:precorrin-3B synthase